MELISKLKTVVFYKWQYPQYEFGYAVSNYVQRGRDNKKLLDAPCGNGETSYTIASKNPGLPVFAYDISGAAISNANKNFGPLKNLHFAVADIFDVVNKHSEVDYFCMINSIFLLPDQNLLVDLVHKSLHADGKFMLIIPNIEGKNYKDFRADHPTFNSMELRDHEFADFMKKHNFKMIHREGVCFANFYGRIELKLFSYLSPFYFRFLNNVMKLFNKKTPSYWFMVFEKSIINEN